MKTTLKKALAAILTIILMANALFGLVSCDEEAEETTAPEAEITKNGETDATSPENTADVTTDVTTNVTTDITTDITTDVTTDITTDVTTDVTTTPPETTEAMVETTPEGYPIIKTAEQLAEYKVSLGVVSLNNKLFAEVTESNGQTTYIDISQVPFDANGNVTVEWFKHFTNGTPLAFNKSLIQDAPVIIKDTIKAIDEDGKIVDLSVTDNNPQFINDENGVLKNIIAFPRQSTNAFNGILTYNAITSDKYTAYTLNTFPQGEQTPFSWDSLNNTAFNLNNFIANGNNEDLNSLLITLSSQLGEKSKRHITIYKNDIPSYEFMYNSSTFTGYYLDKDGNRTLDVAYFIMPDRTDYGIKHNIYKLDVNGNLVGESVSSKEILELGKESVQFRTNMYNCLMNLMLDGASYTDCFVIEPFNQMGDGNGTIFTLGINSKNGLSYLNLSRNGKKGNYIMEHTDKDGNVYTIKSDNDICGEGIIYKTFGNYTNSLSKQEQIGN